MVSALAAESKVNQFDLSWNMDNEYLAGRLVD